MGAGPSSSAGPPSPVIRSAPERFLETWLDAMGGFLFCVVLPIPIYATGEPFAGGIGAMEQTILATAAAYVIVWYCGRRLEAFPRVTLQGNIGYIAPVAAIAYATIAVLLLLLRSDYSRVQLFGSGFLAILWMAFVGQLKARYLARNYAVLPSSLVEAMPGLPTCHWLPFENVERDGIRVDAIVADLGAGLTERQVSALAGAAIAGVPVLDRRYIVETLTGRTPLGGLTPNEFGALLPSRQYLVVRRSIELLLTVLFVPVFLPMLAVVALAIRLDSPGPIFFIQTRVGRRGRSLPDDQVPHDVPRRVRAELHGAGRYPHHACRMVPAALAARRAAAVHQRPEGRHELGRAAARSARSRAVLCARHSALRAAQHRPPGHHRLGADQPGLRPRLTTKCARNWSMISST